MVVKRLLAQQQLQLNPEDSTVQKELADIELQVKGTINTHAAGQL